MEMNTSIRTMTAHDFPILAAWMVETPLWQRYGLTFERAVANFQKALTNGDWLLTADSPHMAACGFAWVDPTGAFERSPYLRLIGVYPSATGRGIGAALLSAVEDLALNIGSASDMFLLTSDFNDGAQRFYKSHGYEQIGAIPDYVVPSITELIFRKRLK